MIKLIGTTFKKEVIDNDKDVLIYLESKKYKESREFEPELIKLARKKNNSKLLVVTIDSTLNDVDELKINDLPSIIFYQGNAKDEEPFEMRERNIENILREYSTSKNVKNILFII